MSDILLETINKLPPAAQESVLQFAEFLLEQAKHQQPSSSTKPRRQAGGAENDYKMSDDFDAPLDDMKEYM